MQDMPTTLLVSSAGAVSARCASRSACGVGRIAATAPSALRRSSLPINRQAVNARVVSACRPSDDCIKSRMVEVAQHVPFLGAPPPDTSFSPQSFAASPAEAGSQ